MQETWDRSLGWEDPLKEGMATHSSILAWRISRTEEPGRLHTVHGVAKSWDTTEQLSFSLSFIVQCVLRMFVIIYSKKYTHTQNEGNTVNFTMS